MAILEEFGPAAGMPHVKAIGTGLWELRGVGTSIRAVFFFDSPLAIVLTVFHKKQDRIPSAELKRAGRNRRQYLENPIAHSASLTL